MPDKSKFEREIDEILEKTESKSDSRPSGRRKFEPFSPTVPKRNPPAYQNPITVDPGKLIIIGIILLAVAAFIPVARLPLAIVGLALAGTGYVMWFRRGGRGSGGSGWRGRAGGTGSAPEKSEPQVKYWRGRRIEEKPDPPAKSSNPDDRGKIIDFGPPPDDF